MPRAVQCIAVIGAGTMGSGIAIAALDAGYKVLLLEQQADALERGANRIHAHYAARVQAGKLKAAVAAASEARLSPSLDWPRIAEADLVIEAVFEELAVKQQVFQRIDALARPGAVLASNTSYLDLDAIAAATSRPQDVIGLHFFSPANVMKLMEVVRGTASAPDALATGLAVGRKLKKLPVLTGNAFGFVGNRLYAAYRRQCEFMVEEGAWPEQVDAALEAFGFAMGPFAVADLSGLDIAWRMRQAQAEAHKRARPGRTLRAHRRPAVRSRPPGPQDRRRLLPLCRGRVAAAGGPCGACADRPGAPRQGHHAARAGRRQRSSAARCWRWSTKRRCCWAKAWPSVPPMSTWCWSTATASRAGKAGRCSGRANAARGAAGRPGRTGRRERGRASCAVTCGTCWKRSAEMHATQIFARFARQLAERPLPDKVVHHAQRAVIDWYASLYPGLDTPAVQVLEATLADDLDRGDARLALWPRGHGARGGVDQRHGGPCRRGGRQLPRRDVPPGRGDHCRRAGGGAGHALERRRLPACRGGGLRGVDAHRRGDGPAALQVLAQHRHDGQLRCGRRGGQPAASG